jgi:hypothetical protein
MLEKIFLLESGVIRGLLVALVGLAGVIASMFGIDQALFNAKASQLVDALNVVLVAGGVFYAGWARATKPNPPITDGAVAKTAVRIGVEGSVDQGGYATLTLLGAIALSAAVVLALPGCVGTKAAYAAAGSPDETAYVVAEHYAAVVGQAAALAKDPGLPRRGPCPPPGG